MDPFGFAFGGVDPGTLHAHGKLVKVHSVHYSIGLAGKYRLHVGLRQQERATASHSARTPAAVTQEAGPHTLPARPLHVCARCARVALSLLTLASVLLVPQERTHIHTAMRK